MRRWLVVGGGPVLAAVALLLATLAQGSEVEKSNGNPLPARAGELSLKVEPGVAFPLSRPQSRIFDVGGGETIKALLSLNGYLDLGPSVTFVDLPAEESLNASGTAWAFGGSLRLKRPHDAFDDDAYHAVSPWLDVDALYVRTGKLDRPGFAAAAS